MAHCCDIKWSCYWHLWWWKRVTDNTTDRADWLHHLLQSHDLPVVSQVQWQLSMDMQTVATRHKLTTGAEVEGKWKMRSQNCMTINEEDNKDAMEIQSCLMMMMIEEDWYCVIFHKACSMHFPSERSQQEKMYRQQERSGYWRDGFWAGCDGLSLCDRAVLHVSFHTRSW